MKQYRTIDGNWANEENCVAFCCYGRHKGYLTEKQLKMHRCLSRQCKKMRKLQDRKFWGDRKKRKQEQKERRKNSE